MALLNVDGLFYSRFSTNRWQMSHAERLALVSILDRLRPVCSIEIGTKLGGSLSVLSAFSEKVFSLDIDPDVPARLTQFSNVEFIVGDSKATFPKLVKRLNSENVQVGFVLIDGNHTEEGVLADCQNLLALRPRGDLVVLMHDSFIPAVRRAIIRTNFAANQYVHSLELDFVAGTLVTRGEDKWRLAGGFAFALLSSEPRQSPLRLLREMESTWRRLYWQSIDGPLLRWPLRIARKLGVFR